MTMPAELSSNWKKLQAQIKAESSAGKKETPAGKKAPAGKQSPAKTTKTTTKTKPNNGTPARAAGKKRPHQDGDNGNGATCKRRAGEGKPTAAKPTSTKPFSQKPKPMGITQSSQPVDRRPPASSFSSSARPRAPSPSLALWAADHDISPEDLAQAYGLAGTGRGGPRSYLARARGGGGAFSSSLEDRQAALKAAAADDRPNAGLTPGLVVGKYIALDCEMVGVAAPGAGGGGGGRRRRGDGDNDNNDNDSGRRTDALARVSVVDFFGRQVYDAYVQLQPGQRVVDWRTAVSGVTPRLVRADAGARPYDEVRATIRDLLAGTLANGDDDDDHGRRIENRILVGHDVKHDLRVLELSHPPRLVRDTARFGGFKKYGNGPKPALRVLAREVLGVAIQQGAHSSVEDARITMELFRLHKPAFDVEHANTFREEGAVEGGGSHKKKGKKKKK